MYSREAASSGQSLLEGSPNLARSLIRKGYAARSKERDGGAWWIRTWADRGE